MIRLFLFKKNEQHAHDKNLTYWCWIDSRHRSIHAAQNYKLIRWNSNTEQAQNHQLHSCFDIREVKPVSEEVGNFSSDIIPHVAVLPVHEILTGAISPPQKCMARVTCILVSSMRQTKRIIIEMKF